MLKPPSLCRTVLSAAAGIAFAAVTMAAEPVAPPPMPPAPPAVPEPARRRCQSSRRRHRCQTSSSRRSQILNRRTAGSASFTPPSPPGTLPK